MDFDTPSIYEICAWPRCIQSAAFHDVACPQAQENLFACLLPVEKPDGYPGPDIAQR
jgi:hypothetical protein